MQQAMLVDDLKRTIREVPDFPKAGINFYDVSTLFRNPDAFRSVVQRMVARYRGEKLDALAGIEARGFLLAGAMALELGVGVILVRKPGKLPAEVDGEDYDLEYGSARIEIHRDAVAHGDRVLVVDDLLATGGTAAAAGRLLERMGARIEGYAFMVELSALEGRNRLGGGGVFGLLRYDGPGGRKAGP